MKTVEVRKKIANSNAPKWFKAVEVTIEYSHIKFKQQIKSFSAIHKFLTQQIEGWNEYDEIPKELKSSEKHFIDLKMELDRFINMYETQNESSLINYWKPIQNRLQNRGNFFTYDSPYTEFLININEKLPAALTGAYQFIIGSHNMSSRDSFIGGLLAYEFELKDKTELTQRRGKEKISISKLKRDFREQLNESEQQLTEHLTKANQEYQSHVTLIDGFKEEKEKLFDSWFSQSKKTFSEFDSKTKERISDLEKTYEELLRLKKPAEYWKKRAGVLIEEGWKAIYWLIGLVVFACITLYFLLWLTPAGMLLSFAEGNFSAIKWSIIYVTFISFLAYGIRALHKVAFSSFHLARDAEEREQLTYVYLSLIKDKAVDEKDKNLILQSLFSRADTGLLKDDSGPTMPNDFAGKLFGK